MQKEHEKNENKALCELVDRSPVSGSTIVLADRNYGSLNNLAHLENRGWNYVIRLKERDSVFGVQLPDSPVFDVPVTLTLGRLSKRQLEKAGASIPENYCHLTNQRTFDFLPVGSTAFYTLCFRIARIETSDGKTETLITNLALEEFPPEKLKTLYAKRWGIETSFRSLKYTVGLIHLHSKIPALILQEIFAAFLIFNFAQAVSWGGRDASRTAEKKAAPQLLRRCLCLLSFPSPLYEEFGSSSPQEMLSYMPWQSLSQTFLLKQPYFLLLSFFPLSVDVDIVCCVACST